MGPLPRLWPKNKRKPKRAVLIDVFLLCPSGIIIRPAAFSASVNACHDNGRCRAGDGYHADRNHSSATAVSPGRAAALSAAPRRGAGRTPGPAALSPRRLKAKRLKPADSQPRADGDT